MTALVIAEHDKNSLKSGTANAVTAAAKMGGDVHVLVAGSGAKAAADAAAKLAGVTKVLQVDAAHYDGGSPENYAALVAPLAKGYSHVVASASAFGKGFMPRVAALLEVAQVSEIIAVEAPDTFVRPIYAGNAFATVQSADAVKVVTVRATGFEAAAATGSAAVEAASPGPDKQQSRVLSQELTRSARPELGGARRVVSGGRGLARTSSSSRRWPTSSAPRSAPRAPRWTRASAPTTTRSGRRARSSPRSSMSPSASRARSSTWPA
jgi:electron transfer flavoprotein alpha subunit